MASSRKSRLVLSVLPLLVGCGASSDPSGMRSDRDEAMSPPKAGTKDGADVDEGAGTESNEDESDGVTEMPSNEPATNGVAAEVDRASCDAEGIECGLALTEAFDPIECGACASGMCGGGGANRCGLAPCPAPPTCQAFGAVCGLFSDECASLINCGNCDETRSCANIDGGFRWRCSLPEAGCSAPLDGAISPRDLGTFLEGKWQPCWPHIDGGGFQGEEAGVEFTADGTWYALSLVDGELVRNGSSGTLTIESDGIAIGQLHTSLPAISVEPKAMAIAVDPFGPRYVPFAE